METINKLDTSHLDRRFFQDDGVIKLLPACAWQDVDPQELISWCYSHGIYGIPTVELVEYLREAIGGRRSLEIGAGRGGLSYHLGIRGTDSMVQTKDEVILGFYKLTGQAPTKPLRHVQPMDANKAVLKHKPEVVIASWVTRRFIPGQDIEGKAQAFVHGVDEEEILSCESVDEYIHIGNEGSHAQKTILAIPHTEMQPDWLISRSATPAGNVIYQWNGPESRDWMSRAAAEEDAEIRDIYARIPPSYCKGLCHDSCGPILMSPAEADRIKRALGYKPDFGNISKDGHCPMLVNNKCSMYEHRPAICQLWGSVDKDGMRCPYGCSPDRLMTNEEGLGVLRDLLLLRAKRARLGNNGGQLETTTDPAAV